MFTPSINQYHSRFHHTTEKEASARHSFLVASTTRDYQMAVWWYEITLTQRARRVHLSLMASEKRREEKSWTIFVFLFRLFTPYTFSLCWWVCFFVIWKTFLLLTLRLLLLLSPLLLFALISKKLLCFSSKAFFSLSRCSCFERENSNVCSSRMCQELNYKNSCVE